MNDKTDAFATFLRLDLGRRYQPPGDLPGDMMALIEKICPRD